MASWEDELLCFDKFRLPRSSTFNSLLIFVTVVQNRRKNKISGCTTTSLQQAGQGPHIVGKRRALFTSIQAPPPEKRLKRGALITSRSVCLSSCLLLFGHFKFSFFLIFFLKFFSLSFYFFWLFYSLSFFKFCSILLFSRRLLSSVVVCVVVLFFFLSLWRLTWRIKFIFSVLVADFSEQVSGNGPLPHRRRELPGGVQTAVHTAHETRAEGIDSEWLAVMYRHHPANTKLLSHFSVSSLHHHHPSPTTHNFDFMNRSLSLYQKNSVSISFCGSVTSFSNVK